MKVKIHYDQMVSHNFPKFKVTIKINVFMIYDSVSGTLILLTLFLNYTFF